MEPEQVIKWCKEKDMDVKKAFVLSDVADGITDDDIYKVLDAVKMFGKCKIRERYSGHNRPGQLVLVETTQDVTTIGVPEQLATGCSQRFWVVNVGEAANYNEPNEDFQSK